MTRARRLLPCLLLAVVLVGCAGGGPPHGPEQVRAVPTQIVPATLSGAGLTIRPSTTGDFSKAIAAAGKDVLVGDGRVWELHAGSRLVGALQLATLKKRVDPSRQADRDAVVRQILQGSVEQIDVDGLPVWTLPGKAGGRAIFVWFGADIFGVLQLKGQGVRLEATATELIEQLVARDEWRALPPETYEDAPDAS